LGRITAVGGETVRDILRAQVRSVLRTEVCVTAALPGSVLMIAGRKPRLFPTQAAVMGATFCFLLRVLSVWQHGNWRKAVIN
jgi:uncharacterized membrane protein YeiH